MRDLRAFQLLFIYVILLLLLGIILGFLLKGRLFEGSALPWTGNGNEEKIADLESQARVMQEIIKNLSDESAQLKLKLSEVDTLSISFREVLEKKRFVAEENAIYPLPIPGLKPLRKIEPNSVIEVLDRASIGQEQWLYVSVPVYDTPINYKGWIPERQTARLTEENVKLVQSDMTIKEGTPIYLVEEDTPIKLSSPTEISSETHGRIVRRQEPFVYLSCPGGFYFWVEEKYLIYPEVIK